MKQNKKHGVLYYMYNFEEKKQVYVAVVFIIMYLKYLYICIFGIFQ